MSVLDEANSWNEKRVSSGRLELNVGSCGGYTLTKLADALTNNSNVLCWDSTEGSAGVF